MTSTQKSSTSFISAVIRLLMPALILTTFGASVLAQTKGYVTNAGSDTLSVIDTATNTVTGSIPAGSTPVGLAITPNGDFIYVGNDITTSVSVISTATNDIVANIPLGPFSFPGGIAITPDGAFAYVTIQVNSRVAVIDTATNTVIASVPVGMAPFGIAITPDGRFVYVANRGL